MQLCNTAKKRGWERKSEMFLNESWAVNIVLRCFFVKKAR